MAADLRAALEAFEGATVAPDAAPLTVAVPADRWRAFAAHAKAAGFTYFSFLSAIDWKEEGLEVVAWIDNVDEGASLRMRTKLGAGTTVCESIVPMFRGADWMERECFDMFGIRFDGHPDLRRILLDDNWEGHPLLKSYAVDTPHPPYR